jgi:ferritin
MGVIYANILSLLQAQYKHEISNYFRYLARSSWARFRGLENTGDFFEKEAEGEKGHADIVRKYIEDRNEALDPAGLVFADSSLFATFDELFTTAQIVERETTDSLQAIYAESFKAGDYMTCEWMMKLIKEQVLEESEYQTIIDRIVQRGGGIGQEESIKAFRNDISAVHDIDLFLGERA